MAKQKMIVLVLSVILLFSMIIYKDHYEKTSIFSADIIKESQKSELIENKSSIDESIELFFNDYSIPDMDDNTAFLLPQGTDRNYKGTLKCYEYDLAIVSPNEDKEVLMRENIPLDVVLYNDTEYKEVKLYLTNLPVINLEPISYEYDHYRDGTEYEIVTGNLQVINPNGNGTQNTFEVYEGLAKFRIRGASTRAYPKHSYKLNLIDEEGNAVDKDLLEMRDDNDWILNAMFLDEAKVRESIAYEFWNLTNGTTKHKNAYVEVINDDRYRGLYLMQEPIDYKTFNAKKSNSVLYSVKGFLRDYSELFSKNAYELKSEIVSEIQIEDSEQIDYEMAIDALRAVINDVEGNQTDLEINYNLKSLIDYQLLLDMVLASDNSFKNQTFLITNKNGDYYFDKTIWDLDLCILKNTYTDNVVTDLHEDEIIPIKIKESSEYKDGLKYTYAKYRKEFYNLDSINGLLDNYFDIIEAGGAILRDSVRWGNDEYEEIKELMYDFFVDRIKVLDEHYGYKGN